LVGTLNRFTRENPNNFGKWYHGLAYLDTPAGQYECAIDVATPSGILVQYQIVANLDQNLLAPVIALSPGFHTLATNVTSGAIDYVRSPLFLQGPPGTWIDSSGDNALNEIGAQLSGALRVFIFGEPYLGGNRLGVHNIHMNQGDPPGPHRADDGIWQDGGTIVTRPGGQLVAVLTKFETQSLHTDNSGLPY